MRKRDFILAILFMFIGIWLTYGNNSSVFGRSEKLSFSFVGEIYYLNEGTGTLPDFSKIKPVGKIYTDILNIQPRYFSQGFPGVTDRFEWFAIRYRGNFYLSSKRKIKFYLLSDDGSKLIIDGKCIIENDGIHPPTKKAGSVELSEGFHKIEVQYFQGPKYQVALVLSYDKEGEETVFNIKDFVPFKVDESKCELSITIGNALLFDFNKFNIRNDTKAFLDKILEEIKEIKYEKIVIEGHTDSIGSKSYNLKLSKKRAESVKKYLMEKGIDEGKIETVGYGEEKPIESNSTEEGRAKNRRVEIKVYKECGKNGIKRVTLKEIGENLSYYSGKTVELEGYARGWMANPPEEIKKLFRTLPFAKKNTGLSRNWGSFTDGTAIVLFPIAPTEYGKFRVKAKIVVKNNGEWYLDVVQMSRK